MNRKDMEDILAEAERRWPAPRTALYEGLRAGFVLGALWERENNSEALKEAEKKLSNALWAADYDRQMAGY